MCPAATGNLTGGTVKIVDETAPWQVDHFTFNSVTGHCPNSEHSYSRVVTMIAILRANDMTTATASGVEPHCWAAASVCPKVGTKEGGDSETARSSERAIY